jgi:hypothetical protein
MVLNNNYSLTLFLHCRFTFFGKQMKHVFHKINIWYIIHAFCCQSDVLKMKMSYWDSINYLPLSQYSANILHEQEKWVIQMYHLSIRIVHFSFFWGKCWWEFCIKFVLGHLKNRAEKRDIIYCVLPITILCLVYHYIVLSITIMCFAYHNTVLCLSQYYVLSITILCFAYYNTVFCLS